MACCVTVHWGGRMGNGASQERRPAWSAERTAGQWASLREMNDESKNVATYYCYENEALFLGSVC